MTLTGCRFNTPLALTAVAVLVMPLATAHGRVVARHADTGGRVSAVSLTHGLRIEISTARAAYPLSVLIQVRIRMKNVSGKTIRLVRYACSPYLNWTSVMGRKGQVLFPPALAGGPVPSCPNQRPVNFVAGRGYLASTIVVLRAAKLVPNVMMVLGHSIRPVSGKPLVMTLRPGGPEHATLHAGPGRLHSGIWPLPPGSGSQIPRLRWAFVETCRKTSAYGRTNAETTASLPFTWVAMRTHMVYANNLSATRCNGGMAWHLVAGWLGHPVARLDYVARP